MRLLLDQLTLSDASLFCLGAQDGPDGDAERLRLHERHQERAQFVDVRTAVDSFEGFPVVRAHTYLPEEPGELLTERSRHRADRPGHGLVEPKAGFDTDHEQLDQDGQVAAYVVLALTHGPVEGGLRT